MIKDAKRTVSDSVEVFISIESKLPLVFYPFYVLPYNCPYIKTKKSQVSRVESPLVVKVGPSLAVLPMQILSHLPINTHDSHFSSNVTSVETAGGGAIVRRNKE